MIICKNCGIELEEGMQACPLCGWRVDSNGKNEAPAFQQPLLYSGMMTRPQKKFTWEIISLVLLSIIVATLIINFIINKKITWSEYPAAICFIIFSYVSLFAFWQQRTVIQMAVGFVLSSACISVIDAVTGGISWTLWLGIPLLLATNIIIVVLLIAIRSSKNKGVNLLAWVFLAVAILCICVEAILSYYQIKTIRFTWSVIVGGCTIPVILVLLFLHFRLKKGRSLKKTFHI